MARQQTIGNLGEEKATLFLQEIGYKILERNWRFSKAEIDIIAKDGEVLVFVEVKSKSYTFFGAPEESVSAYKENLIIDAAHQFMIKIGHDWEIRFDIISIVFDKNKDASITHFKDAFFPSL
ncbi:MAG: YraN family protein [Saprospiraceae bacterium]|nr:YraN family protein [Saprospiraceae bacterium]MBP6568358.1 YraN family protein [Saprospiraceae bacterium]